MTADAPARPVSHVPVTLFVLSLGNFVVGIAAFVVIGLMTTITGSLRIDPAEGSSLVTDYAIAYALGSPMLIAASGRMPRRAVVTFAMALISLGSLGCALAPTLGHMQLARVIGAFGGGLYSPATAAIAVSMVPPARRAWALSQVFIGFTAAQGIGNATGTYLGYNFGYAWTFAIVGVLSLGMTAALWRFVPRETAFSPTSMVDLARILKQPHMLIALLFTVCFVGSTYTTVTQLTLILERRAHLTGNGVSFVLLVYGGMAFVAAVTSSQLIDRFGPSRFLSILCISLLFVLPLVTQGPTEPFSLTLVLAIWSLLGWSHFTAQQSRLVTIDPSQAQLILALNSSMLYVGIALGSWLAGHLLKVPEFVGLAIGAECLIVVAICVLLIGDRVIARHRAVPTSG